MKRGGGIQMKEVWYGESMETIEDGGQSVL
jgi:hypothetical protein